MLQIILICSAGTAQLDKTIHVFNYLFELKHALQIWNANNLG